MPEFAIVARLMRARLSGKNSRNLSALAESLFAQQAGDLGPNLFRDLFG
jgi:hypothetical protein